MHLWINCGHTTFDRRRCADRPFCDPRVDPRVVTHTFCPSCRDNPLIVPSYTQSRRADRAARRPRRDNDYLAGFQRASHAPRIPALHAPEIPGPQAAYPHSTSDPFFVALQNHRQRMNELENRYQLIMQGLQTRRASQELNIHRLDSLHRSLVDLNRRHVAQLEEFIEVLERIPGQRDPTDASPMNRNAVNQNSPQRPPGFNLHNLDPPGFDLPDLDRPGFLREENGISEFDLERGSFQMFDLEAEAFPELERQGPHPFPNEASPLHNLPEREPGNASRILASVSLETLSAEERRCTICLQDIDDGDDDSPVRLPC